MGGKLMRKYIWAAAVSGLLMTLASVGFAQQHHTAGHDAHAKHSTETRILISPPADLIEHMLTSMRDHLLALQEIQAALARGETEKAAQLAEQRLGMSSLASHGAHAISKYMPSGMQETGTAMHRAASRFALIAQEAGATGDLKPPLAALAAITAQCVGCHAGYRVK
jgi:hypothetical protein